MPTDPRTRPEWSGGEGGRAWRKTSYREWRRRLVHDVKYFRAQGYGHGVHGSRMLMVKVRRQLAADEIPLYWPGLFDD